ncbi:uncharacterized protein [Anabrus simplex]|uniref:uncharacterized protein n=1 Tax=Anabrus simplex TaxID=316456 RepID=UPI0035A38540
MASYGYVQLFLFGLLCIGAASAENSTCTTPRALSGLNINKVYGDWFLGKWYGPNNMTLGKSLCLGTRMKKFNETTFEAILDVHNETAAQTFTIENSENAGTWLDVGADNTVQVIYLSADVSVMELAYCTKNETEHGLILLSKQLPISPEKKAEVLHAEEIAGVSEHIHFFKWESEATCPSA